MSLFSSRDFGDFLKGAVGNNLKNDPDDVIATKTNLSRAGYFDDDTDNGFITNKLDSAIRRFQRDNDLKEDGVLYPGGETERTIFKGLTGRNPADVFGNQNNGEGKGIGFGGDVLGTLRYQMSNNDDSEDNKPQPQMFRHAIVREDESKTGGIRHLVVEENIYDTRESGLTPLYSEANAAEADSETPGDGEGEEGEEVEYDATGRMIMPEADPSKPDGDSSKDNVAKSGIPDLKNPPSYRNEVFKGDRAKEWNSWTNINDSDKNLPADTSYAFKAIFAAEGGFDKAPNSSAYAGITKTTLQDAIKNGEAGSISQKYGLNPEPSQLSDNDVHEAYKAVFNRAMASAVKGQGKSASELLGELGDTKISSAVADTLFRHGSGEGSQAIQKAINATLPANQAISTSGGFGSGTYNALRGIASDPEQHRDFLDALHDQRVNSPSYDPNEAPRVEFFRFPGWTLSPNSEE